jgi:hypothetical protein
VDLSGQRDVVRSARAHLARMIRPTLFGTWPGQERPVRPPQAYSTDPGHARPAAGQGEVG